MPNMTANLAAVRQALDSALAARCRRDACARIAGYLCPHFLKSGGFPLVGIGVRD
jgi:hypothetical protein